jgi:multicomponent K+:H+ antiporter subunit E
MNRWLPAPWISVIVFALWLVLNARSAGHVALAAALAIAIPVLVAPLRPTPVRIRRPRVAARLLLTVDADVVGSNLSVAWSLLNIRRRPLRSGFVEIPLDLDDPNGLAVLAVITTIVPGTVWAELAVDRSALLLHVFDFDDEARFVARYKARYEQPLIEMFG